MRLHFALGRLSILLVVAMTVAMWGQPAPAFADVGGGGPCPVNRKPVADGTFVVSSGFGPRDGGFHAGIDLAAGSGTDIFAALDGTVAAAGPASGFGQWIVVDTPTRTGVVSTVYGHMYPDGVLVRTGDVVKAGQHIAEIGSNGQSSGPHLHFELWEGGRFNGSAVDPAPLLNEPSSSGSSVVDLVASTTDCSTGVLTPGLVPPEFVPWLLKAGSLCPGIAAPILAAQLEAENGFRYGPSAPASSTGARGPAQFMPATWSTWGKDYDGSGPPPDVNSIADAVMAQGALMCENYRQCADGITGGRVVGDPVALALAAYNAGFGAVLDAGGMPFGGEYTTQTQPYVKKILERAKAFAAATWAPPGATIAPVGGVGSGIVDFARKLEGTPWVWGGGNVDGATNGGIDSPGLTRYAVGQATASKVVLPRSTQEQWSVGDPIPLDELEPGDLVFSEWNQFDMPTHVGIAIGEGRMIHASMDDGVTVSNLHPDTEGRRVR
ncbi:peptidoglycan DD-metalloendopeptidase family protein [Rhodococcus opacus]|uniref:peptidoglycan DD-metalloendopeptidase family protein n=1 Tax=Rhodococcus opacus TaxID=37919 RepID=UPI000AAD7CEB|nr:peptidoglycan DD-metalloendopeptidase family protein [Rhodococcus opacus]